MTDPHHEADQPWQESEPSDNYCRRARLVRVVDADTLVCDIDMGGHLRTVDTLRLAWANAPEHRGPEYAAGHWVTGQVLAWFGEVAELRVRSVNFSTGRYGRYIAEVWCSGQFLNRWLLTQRYAWPTDHTGAIVGPRDIDRLTGLPDHIRSEVRRRQG